jgi:hypothetical protein
MVLEHEGVASAIRVETSHPVLFPSKTHRRPIGGKIDVADHRAFIHLRRSATTRTSLRGDYLLEDELHVRAMSCVIRDATIFQPY